MNNQVPGAPVAGDGLSDAERIVLRRLANFVHALDLLMILPAIGAIVAVLGTFGVSTFTGLLSVAAIISSTVEVRRPRRSDPVRPKCCDIGVPIFLTALAIVFCVVSVAIAIPLVILAEPSYSPHVEYDYWANRWFPYGLLAIASCVILLALHIAVMAQLTRIRFVLISKPQAFGPVVVATIAAPQRQADPLP